MTLSWPLYDLESRNSWSVIYITNQIFPLSRSYKGQLKVKGKCCIKIVYLFLFYLYMVVGLIGNIFRLILYMSTISRYGKQSYVIWHKFCILVHNCIHVLLGYNGDLNINTITNKTHYSVLVCPFRAYRKMKWNSFPSCSVHFAVPHFKT